MVVIIQPLMFNFDEKRFILPHLDHKKLWKALILHQGPEHKCPILSGLSHQYEGLSEAGGQCRKDLIILLQLIEGFIQVLRGLTGENKKGFIMFIWQFHAVVEVVREVVGSQSWIMGVHQRLLKTCISSVGS